MRERALAIRRNAHIHTRLATVNYIPLHLLPFTFELHLNWGSQTSTFAVQLKVIQIPFER